MNGASMTEVRSARSDEAARLTQIAFAAKRHWGYGDALIDLWADELTVSRELVAEHPVYCAERNAEIVGFYALSEQDAGFELEHMWVDPQHIGSGVGTLLFEHAVRTVVSLGGSELVIVADPNAEGFYRKMGAAPAGTVPSRPEGRRLPLLRLVV